MTYALQLKQIINYPSYPIDDKNIAKRRSVIDQVRAEITVDGCAVIRKNFSKAGLQALLTEANERKTETYCSPSKLCNA